MNASPHQAIRLRGLILNIRLDPWVVRIDHRHDRADRTIRGGWGGRMMMTVHNVVVHRSLGAIDDKGRIATLNQARALDRF